MLKNSFKFSADMIYIVMTTIKYTIKYISLNQIGGEHRKLYPRQSPVSSWAPFGYWLGLGLGPGILMGNWEEVVYKAHLIIKKDL